MSLSSFSTVTDPLYGSYELDSFLHKLISQPEVQRLREVRLSNINSFLMPGSANISRFEHSLGTAHLAVQIAHQFGLSKRDYFIFVCAALLHDVAITPFGHLLEEGFRYAGREFDHEKRLEEIFLGKTELGNINVQIYRGRSVGFHRVFASKEIRQTHARHSDVFVLKQGNGPLGKLINGTIDIDNIDNVCRMAHHLGIPFRRELPLELIRGFFVHADELRYSVKHVFLLHEWLALRETLYNMLMTNPADFAAKTMLIEAIKIALTGTDSHLPVLDIFDWKLTDADLIQKLDNYEPTNDIIDRLLRGDLFEVIALLWLDVNSLPTDFLHPANAMRLRTAFAARLDCQVDDIVVYFIKDKRTRVIDNLTFSDLSNPSESTQLSIGRKPTKALVGVTTRRRNLASLRTLSICQHMLSDLIGKDAVTICEPIKHINRAVKAGSPESPVLQQPSLL